MQNFFYRLLSILLILFCTVNCSQDKIQSTPTQTKQVTDSIEYYVKQYKTSKSFDKGRDYLTKAHKLCRHLNDSTRFNCLLSISNLIYKKDTVLFKKMNAEKLTLAVKLKDTLKIGLTEYMYGYYYLNTQRDLDTAYYFYNKASKLFKKIDHKRLLGRSYFDMAQIRSDFNDNTGTEKLTFQALKEFEMLEELPFKFLYNCHNHLGSNFAGLKEFDKALIHYDKALIYASKTDDKTLAGTIYNNIGLVHKEKKDYVKAIEYYKKGLDYKPLKYEYPKLYATLKSNLAYNKLKTYDTLGVYENLIEALKIRDSLKIYKGISSSYQHLAEYCAYNKDTLKAIQYANLAEEVARNAEGNVDRFRSLKLLSILDKKNADDYLKTYIDLTDKIHAEERKVRNKFTRIEYETDAYIEETERLTTQNILISVIGGIFVVLLGLLYFIRQQRAKNKELLFEQEQQRANEEIYILMQKQQTNLEEGRTQERHRISEELHDGVLGKLFGARVGMGFLDLTGDQEDVNEYKSYLGELQGIEKEIRDISHALKNNILKSDTGFIDIIEDYVAGQLKVHHLNYDIEKNKNINWSNIDDKLKVALYRIIQEAIQNIVKHANANNVSIAFTKTEKTLHLSIKDDGKGFINLKHKKGIGLKNMENRVLKLNGGFNVESKPNQGTIIKVSVST
ncbi:tetratricopeptide repeat-containing sensor histidine kinase [Seonamhaeicola marinus]|uniref:histidine kinase n=1 Tax=Seonamhaeicola marinus TaxID=1912246 RepID=A0A5D0IUS9_9FLAO|nr:sensor histidine kinase [Seonamhaeicola marinus]TYA86809.1 tetratricopeptide repeat protein [Seonamhaeicola marinus]